MARKIGRDRGEMPFLDLLLAPLHAVLGPEIELVNLGLAEPLFAMLTLGVQVGLVIASPVLVYEVGILLSVVVSRSPETRESGHGAHPDAVPAQ